MNCQLHTGSKLTMHCTTCDTLLCDLCTEEREKGIHTTHKIESIKTLMEGMKSSIVLDINEMVSHLQQECQLLSKLTQYKEDVKSVFEELRKELDTQEQKLNNQIDIYKSESQKRLENQYMELDMLNRVQLKLNNSTAIIDNQIDSPYSSSLIPFDQYTITQSIKEYCDDNNNSYSNNSNNQQFIMSITNSNYIQNNLYSNNYSSNGQEEEDERQFTISMNNIINHSSQYEKITPLITLHPSEDYQEEFKDTLKYLMEFEVDGRYLNDINEDNLDNDENNQDNDQPIDGIYKNEHCEYYKKEEDDLIDLQGFKLYDIELVMAQSGSSKSKAIDALKMTNGDIICAIMQLSL